MSSGSGMRLVLLGPPGSGKGTQAERLVEHLGVPAISTGDMIRDAVASGSGLGRRVEQIMEQGDLVDDETMASLVRERLAEDDVAEGFLLDGYPRTLPQADTLAGLLLEQGRQLDGVLMIDVPEEELLRRMLARQREDDREDVIRHRLGLYRRETRPLVAHYRDLDLLHEIDGNQSIDDVEAAVIVALESMTRGVA